MRLDSTQVTILGLGAKGHGVTNINGEKKYLKYALPGEQWEVDLNGTARRLSDGPDRVVPPCLHFGQCGGCVAQHMHAGLYIKWKEKIVQDAFGRRGVKITTKPLRLVSRHSRRRAFLGVECRDDKVIIGYREENRHTLVDITECLVLDSSIVNILEDLKAIAKIAMLKNVPGRIVITKLDFGLDINFQDGLKNLTPDAMAEIYSIAENKPIIRLIISGDTIFTKGDSRLTVGGVQINFPSSVFLQAVPEAEDIMIQFVLNAIPIKVKRVCDLFCGVGTFTFPLAKKVSVSAFDNDRRAIAAIDLAAKKAQGLKPIQTFVRDLFREPLSVRELESFDAVVFDPPRIGAAEQTERFAKSKVSTIIAISCSPNSLARDAEILIRAGYTMSKVTSVDQFIYSNHIECMAVFNRDFAI